MLDGRLWGRTDYKRLGAMRETIERFSKGLPDMNKESDYPFIHHLKVRLTAISGYTQMLEQEVNGCESSSAKQRTYVKNLRRITDELVRDVAKHEAMHRS